MALYPSAGCASGLGQWGAGAGDTGWAVFVKSLENGSYLHLTSASVSHSGDPTETRPPLMPMALCAQMPLSWA